MWWRCVCEGGREKETTGFFVSFFFRPQTTNQQTCCSSLAELDQSVRVLSFRVVVAVAASSLNKEEKKHVFYSRWLQVHVLAVKV